MSARDVRALFMEKLVVELRYRRMGRTAIIYTVGGTVVYRVGRLRVHLRPSTSTDVVVKSLEEQQL